MRPNETKQVLAHLTTLTKLAIRNNALLESIFFSKIVEHAVATGAPAEEVVVEFQERLAENQRAALRVFDTIFDAYGFDVAEIASDRITPEGFPADLIEEILGKGISGEGTSGVDTVGNAAGEGENDASDDTGASDGATRN
jgi:hypothetical protein